MRREPLLTIQVESRDGMHRFELSGELDMSTAPDFAARLSTGNGAGPDGVVVDLSDLRFMDSHGLLALLRADERCKRNGTRLVIVGANAVVRRVFEVTGTGFLLASDGAVGVLHRSTGGGESRASRQADVERDA